MPEEAELYISKIWENFLIEQYCQLLKSRQTFWNWLNGKKFKVEKIYLIEEIFKCGLLIKVTGYEKISNIPSKLFNLNKVLNVLKWIETING